MKKYIEIHTEEEHTRALANYFPSGPVFASKNKLSNLRSFISGMAKEYKRSENYTKLLQDEFIPNSGEAFISDWERALGIPDGCFDTSGTIQERQIKVLVKLASLGVQTAEDFEELALLFGVTAKVSSASRLATFPLTFPVLFIENRFTIIVELELGEDERFPYTFPITLGGGNIATLECLFNKLKPANSVVIFRQI